VKSHFIFWISFFLATLFFGSAGLEIEQGTFASSKVK